MLRLDGSDVFNIGCRHLKQGTEARPMRILLATSFPVPGEYDGTAMLPIKILRALKMRGVDVVLAHLAPTSFGAENARGIRRHATFHLTATRLDRRAEMHSRRIPF